MDREQVLKTIREHAPELQAAGVVSVSMFGSRLAARCSHRMSISPFVSVTPFRAAGSTTLELNDLERKLSCLLGCNVDVVEEPVPKEPFQREIDRDRALAF